jgi:uncharacterized membrane protein
VLRPSNDLLGSSRAAYRRGLRAERLKAVWHVWRVLKGGLSRGVTAAVALVLLCGWPFAYLVAAYLAVDLPARWLSHRGAYGNLGALLFVAALAVGAIGIMRAVQGAPPIVPVRPKFAKAMLGLSWVAAALFTIGDLAL